MKKTVTTIYQLGFNDLPPEFLGYTVAHVSDFHNQNHGEDFYNRLSAAKPNAIFVTGDMIHIEGQTQHALQFFRTAVTLAPVYYVSGNHESVLDGYPAFLDEIKSYGVTALLNESVPLCRGEQRIILTGIDDPTFFPIAPGYVQDDDEDEPPMFKSERVSRAERRPAGIGRKVSFKQKLTELASEYPEDFRILLSHRPELKDDYFKAGFTLTLTGHAHGGHIILPLFGPMYAPNQGMRPKLTSGVHYDGNRRMVISRGLGDSHRFPPRFNNPYELVILKLTIAGPSGG